ncbi:MAG: FG-GAP repeat protein [Ignavibacteria bacterium]|nr:FG-GAP repeat protein [Ignavibacteria bacterium]
MNGDGYSDVIIGAIGYGNGQGNEGRIYVYFGSGNGLSLVANWTSESNVSDAIFGWSVSTAGDVNGDGYSDFIASYIGFMQPQGKVFVFHGSAEGLSDSANWTAECNQASAHFGHSVSSAGDLNSDGYSDVIIGAPLYNNGQANEGKVFIYNGSSSGLSDTVNWTIESNLVNAQFGYSVSTAGMLTMIVILM